MSTLGSDTGIVIVDHGSRREAANDMLVEVVERYCAVTGHQNVQHAHMELAGPTVAQAVARCVEAGAETVVLGLFFLSPGRHSVEDLPRLAREAEGVHPGVRVLVSAPLGVDDTLAGLLHKRVLGALGD